MSRTVSISISTMFRDLWSHRELAVMMMRRDIASRYKGSVLGLAWSFVNPILLLSMYTFVFSVVFKARWGGSVDDNKLHFATMLFIGMICHSLFAEVLVRAPLLVVSNANLVKKVVFPLEMLSVIALGAAAFHALISFTVLLAVVGISNQGINITAFLVPLLAVPLMAFALGISWFFSSLGVFFRDIAQPVNLLVTVLLFGSPVFYPLSALPEAVRPWLMLNPLTFVIEQGRALLEGRLPSAPGVAVYVSAAALVAWGGYVWFQKTRKGFANVL